VLDRPASGEVKQANVHGSRAITGGLMMANELSCHCNFNGGAVPVLVEFLVRFDLFPLTFFRVRPEEVVSAGCVVIERQ